MYLSSPTPVPLSSQQSCLDAVLRPRPERHNPMLDTQRWFALERVLRSTKGEPDMAEIGSRLAREILIGTFAPRHPVCNRVAALEAATALLNEVSSTLSK